MRSGPAVTLLIFVFIGGCYVFADLFGLIPKSADLAQFQTYFAPRVASSPYLQKYEGKWHFVIDDGSRSPGAGCGGGASDIIVHNGVIFSSVGALGHARTVHATIAPDGTIDGTLDPGSQRAGVISGEINGMNGSGTWQDNFDCASSFSMTKLDPIDDPIVGKVVTISGTLHVERGGQQQSVFPGASLYVGDVVTVTSGNATLSLGLYPPTLVSLSSNDSYVVPASFQ